MSRLNCTLLDLHESIHPSLTKDTIAGEDDAAGSSSSKKPIVKAPPKACTLREIKLETPIEYVAGDTVKKWLNSLLCLDVTVVPCSSAHSCPHPAQCELFYISFPV
ncbi:hypothetical protein BKA93DRAFT_824923 [Sparassis latifolia]